MVAFTLITSNCGGRGLEGDQSLLFFFCFVGSTFKEERMARALFDSCKSYYSFRLGTCQVTSNGNYIIGVGTYDKEEQIPAARLSMHINLNSNINIIAQLMMMGGTSLACISIVIFYFTRVEDRDRSVQYRPAWWSCPSKRLLLLNSAQWSTQSAQDKTRVTDSSVMNFRETRSTGDSIFLRSTDDRSMDDDRTSWKLKPILEPSIHRRDQYLAKEITAICSSTVCPSRQIGWIRAKISKIRAQSTKELNS